MNYHFLGNSLHFPPVEQADEDGILAIGGDLHPERLLKAYCSGIFPWYSKPDPIIWWSPDPRFVLFPSDLKVSKSMKQVFNKGNFKLSYDTCFEQVMRACGEVPRPGQRGTWIDEDMLAGYCELHRRGYAHSVEVWEDEELVGGLYGVSLGRMFFGESMFSRRSNASKFGFISLVRRLEGLGFQLIDCQVHTEHLESLGAGFISRQYFKELLAEGLSSPTLSGNWGELLKD